MRFVDVAMRMPHRGHLWSEKPARGAGFAFPSAARNILPAYSRNSSSAFWVLGITRPGTGSSERPVALVDDGYEPVVRCRLPRFEKSITDARGGEAMKDIDRMKRQSRADAGRTTGRVMGGLPAFAPPPRGLAAGGGGAEREARQVQNCLAGGWL